MESNSKEGKAIFIQRFDDHAFIGVRKGKICPTFLHFGQLTFLISQLQFYGGGGLQPPSGPSPRTLMQVFIIINTAR